MHTHTHSPHTHTNSHMHTHSNDFKAALQGFMFKNVSELAACKHIPRIVCTTKAHQTGESKSSVQADEILVVRKISRTTVMRKPVLKAFSPRTNEDKTLQVCIRGPVCV